MSPMDKMMNVNTVINTNVDTMTQFSYVLMDQSFLQDSCKA